MRTRSAELSFLGAAAIVSNNVLSAIRSIVGRIQGALHRHATVRSLAALSDRQLRDIGFQRWEIEDLALTGRFPERTAASGRRANAAKGNTL